MRKLLQHLWAQAPFTTIAAGGVALLLLLIGAAIWDSVTSARASSHRVLESALSAELSNFLLSVREPDGSSLLDNPKEFSAAQRSLQPTTLRRSFYSYLLNRGNARSFEVEKLTWEPPRPCIVEFVNTKADYVPVQACVAVSPEESTGRYVFFFIRYPSTPIGRHIAGGELGQADRVVLNVAGARTSNIVLVYQAPTLATARYPSQMSRFAHIHEVAAFAGGSTKPVRQVNGQAFEKADDTREAQNFVTVVGRIDAAMLVDSAATAPIWPDRGVKALQFGFDIYAREGPRKVRLRARVAPGELGNAVDSLQKAYLSSVTSGSAVRVTRALSAGDLVWTSDALDIPRATRRTGWTQAISDWWAPKLMSLLGAPLDTEPLSQHQRYAGASGDMVAAIQSTPQRLPDIATRAFGWLTVAFVLVLLLAAFGTVAVVRLLRVTQSAWAMTINKNYAIDKKRYARKRDEISTLGRLLNMLIARSNSRNAWIRKQDAVREQELRLMREHLKLRQDRLDAIGHEIRSPLQSLLSQTEKEETLQHQLKRMHRAVETLFHAESIEEGIDNLVVVSTRTDVAYFISRLVQNKRLTDPCVCYQGPSDGMFAHIDGLQFELVIAHLIDNASRYRTGGDVVVALTGGEAGPVVTVANQGRRIPHEKLESIFKYRNSDSSLPRNRGIGLYAARSYLFGMKATIRAENHSDGVSMVIDLQPG